MLVGFVHLRQLLVMGECPIVCSHGEWGQVLVASLVGD